MIKNFKKYLVLSLAVLLLIFLIFFFDKALAVGLLLIALLSAITFLALNKLGIGDRKLYMILGLILLLHISVVLLIHCTGFNPFPGGADYEGYSYDAIKIAHRFDNLNFSLEGVALLHYFPVIIGAVYAVTFPAMIVGQLFLVWIVLLSVILLWLLVLEIGGTKKGAFLTGLIAAFYPSFLYFSSLLLKDSLVILLALASLLLIVKILKNFSGLKFLMFFAVLTCLFHFRFYIGFAAIFTFIICWFWISNLKFKERIIYGVAMVLLLGFAPQLTGLGYYGQSPLVSFLNANSIINFREVAYAPKPSDNVFSEFKNDNSGTGSSFTVDVSFGNKYKFVENYLISSNYAFFGPFPWQLRYKKHLLFLLETVPWYFLLCLIFYGAYECLRNNGFKAFLKIYRFTLPILIFSLLVIGALSLFITNFGILARIRIPVFLAMFCLLALGNFIPDKAEKLLAKVGIYI